MSEVTYNRVNWQDTPSTETPINATNLNKMDKGIADVTAAVNECFQSASEGKTLIAAALTGKGQASTASDTYAQMAAKIGNLMAVPTATKNITANGNNIDVKNYAKVNVNVENYISFNSVTVLVADNRVNTTYTFTADANTIGWVVAEAWNDGGYQQKQVHSLNTTGTLVSTQEVGHSNIQPDYPALLRFIKCNPGDTISFTGQDGVEYNVGAGAYIYSTVYLRIYALKR